MKNAQCPPRPNASKANPNNSTSINIISKNKNLFASIAAIVPTQANKKYPKNAKPKAFGSVPAANAAPKQPALIIQLIATPAQKNPKAPKIVAPKIFLW